MIKTLMAAAVAAAFAVPMIAQASAVNDNIVIAQGGGDTGNSSRQPGANPPGAISPGTPRDAATASDRDTGAAAHANPSGAPSSRESTTGATARSGDFDRLDRNHDGYISRDEANNAAELNTRFSELDKNNDGKLSRDEYNAIHAGKRGASGATASSSADGKATKAGAPDKGPGAQEPANRALGSAGSGLPEGGGTSSSK
jgi:EF hand domain-containing protein